MRGLGSVAVVLVAGCASASKPPAPIEGTTVRKASPIVDPSPSDPSLIDPSAPDASPPDASPLTPSPSPSAAPSTSATSATPEPPPATEQRPTAAETRACAARGGTIQPICMMGELACVVRYRDGGKRCSDKRDCTAECLYEGPDPPPPKATGSCQRTSDPCGYKAPIHDGRVEPALCVD